MKKRSVLFLFLILAMLCLALPAQAEDNKCAFDKTVTTLFEGDTLRPSLLLAGDPTAGTVSYTSSSAKVATVDDSGLVTGLSKGSVTITATVRTEKRTYKATIALKVLRKVESISVTETKLTVFQSTDSEVAHLLPAEEGAEPVRVLVLRLGTNQALQAVCEPTDASNRKFTVTSSDSGVVKVAGSTLKPQKAGQCDITVASELNPEVSVAYRVLVVQPVTRLKLSAPEKTAYVGGSLALSAAFTPDNATIQALTWTSANERVATVDENGVVTGISKGTATIRATAKDGSGKYATFSVQVLQQPQSVTLSESSIVVSVGSYKTLRASVLPEKTNNKKVVWSSSDTSVATVNQSGRITPVAPGHCTITAACQDFPQIAASASVEVRQPVTRIAFTQKEVSVNVGSTLQVYWEISPANATVTDVSFSTNKENIATVDAGGLITAHKRGECYITVTAEDGSGKKARILVNVLQPVEGVHMKNDTLSVGVDESITATAELEPSDASNNRMTWYSADERIATVKGSRNRPTITGHQWGTTTITGVTEDGGFTTTATVKVGNYDKALKITDLYLQNNLIKIVVNNESNMNITRFYYTIECFNAQDEPIVCSENGGNAFNGSYRFTLCEGDNTEHGKFTFEDFVQPEEEIARVTMRITGYRTDEGYSRNIREDRQVLVEFTTTKYVGAPEDTPEAEEPAAQ